MANLLCSSFLWEKFSFPWSILSFFRSGLPKPHCVWFWQPSRSQKRKNWSRKRKSFSQKRNCACELCHFSAKLFQLLRRYIPSTWKNFSLDLEKFCIQRLEGTDLFHYLGKIAGLRPATFSGTPRDAENQILSIINSKMWPESPQKHQKIQKSIMLK